MLIKDIWESRRLIFNLAKSDFKAKYAGSVFGIIWAFVQPVITVLIYVVIFGMGIKMTPDTTEYPFLLYLIAGIVPWFFFVEAWQSATNCLVDYSYLVKKMVFKIHILPVVKVVASLFVHLFLAAIALVIFVIMGRAPGITMIQIFYYMFCEICLILALSYATASVTPYFKDMTQLLNVCLQLGMWLTPIMWDEGFWPEWVMRIFRLNPMYYIVTGYRDCYMHGSWITDHLGMTLYFWIFVIVVGCLSWRIFRQMKDFFADHL
jgi:teichoic acid transport system permease protein